MHRPHRHPGLTRPSAPTRGRAGERGFTMVELIVVAAIVLALVGIVALAMRGGKASVRAGEAKAAAAAYQQGIASWQANAANRNPTTADFLPNGRGPRGLDGRAIMTAAPAGVPEGRVAFVANGTNCVGTPTGGGQATGIVSYCTAGMQAPNYGLRVATRANTGAAWSTATICWVGVTPAGQTRC